MSRTARAASVLTLLAAILALLPACRGAGGTETNTATDATADRATDRRTVAVRTGAVRTVAVRSVTGEHVPARVRFDAAGPWHAIDAYGGRALDLPEGLVPAAVEVDGERVARVLTSDDAWLVLLENAPVTMEFQLDDAARETLGARAELVLLQPVPSDASLTSSAVELARTPFDARGRALVGVPPHHLVQVRAAVPGGMTATLDVEPDVRDLDEGQGLFGLLETRRTEAPLLLGVAPDQRVEPAEVRVVDASGAPAVGAELDRFVLTDDGGHASLLVGEGPSVVTDASGTAALLRVDDGTLREFGGLRVRHAGRTWLLFDPHAPADTLALRDAATAGTRSVRLDVGGPVRTAVVAEAIAVRPGVRSSAAPIPFVERSSDAPSVEAGTADFYRSADGRAAGFAAVDADAEVDRLALPDEGRSFRLGSGAEPTLAYRGSIVTIHGSSGELMHAQRVAATTGRAIGVPGGAPVERVQVALEPTVELGRALLGTGLHRVAHPTLALVDGELRVPLATYEVEVVDERGDPLPFAPVWAARFVPRPDAPAFADARGRLTLMAAGDGGPSTAIQALGDWTRTPAGDEVVLLDADAVTTLVAAPHTR